MDDRGVGLRSSIDSRLSDLRPRSSSVTDALAAARAATRSTRADLPARLQQYCELSLSQITLGKNTKASSILDPCSLEYTEEVDDNLICPICRSPFVSPVTLKCQHLFCAQCLTEALDHQQDRQTCPTCRKSITASSIIPLPKAFHRMLEDLTVKCPLASKGCPDILLRGNLRSHLDRHCGYEEVPCPLKDCDEPVPRRLLTTKCLHEAMPCPDCGKDVTLLELNKHQTDLCEVEILCKDCLSSIPKVMYMEHASSCVETIMKCQASEYGCDFVGKRSAAEQHMASCVLAKLAPTIALQNAQLQEHAAALKLLQQKNALHEAFLDTIENTLASASTEVNMLGHELESTAPFDSPLSHLLSLHETLRQEVDRVAAAVSDLDAKTDTAFLNSSLRAKEEAAHRDTVLTQLRIQMQWLVSSRLQGMHGTRAGTASLGISNVNRENNDAERSGARPLPSERRNSDGLGFGGREKL